MSLALSVNSLQNGSYVAIVLPKPHEVHYSQVVEVHPDGFVLRGQSDLLLPIKDMQELISARCVHVYSSQADLPPAFKARIDWAKLIETISDGYADLQKQALRNT
ncbi:TPA: hypothetical protein DDX46_02560 [Candidatus Saccharibacteria bacterium]|nr:hypothetical protein [Candidatus Saccharibacteria bacterium]MBH1972508.1 hypothetical protein [Candidatus Saccharibacteria bacterium]MBH1990150.1 hypothetical protein [Candidatus Saccharibacteria bacterium]HBH77608.1 hypothetical protein [Candidatus Saccharibacteria bacterium]